MFEEINLNVDEEVALKTEALLNKLVRGELAFIIYMHACEYEYPLFCFDVLVTAQFKLTPCLQGSSCGYEPRRGGPHEIGLLFGHASEGASRVRESGVA